METIRLFLPKHSLQEFKSYYVVWKLYFILLCLDLYFMFKSYYVVWKLKKVVYPTFPVPGLNRTMQYGNANSVWRDFFCASGLNRTMQYGNGVGLAMRNPIITGLNRTMQYGNQNSQIEKAFEIAGLNRTMQYGNKKPVSSHAALQIV